MPESNKNRFGWIPDFPDLRDYTPDDSRMLSMTSPIENTQPETLPSSFDLRRWCSPVENQEQLGSCTAHAVSAVVEYFENKSFEKYINASRLFLYKTTRNLMRMSGDTGATLKASLGALILFGMPPEEYWPYDADKFDTEPSPFCYAFGQNYRCISYFRHDPAGVSPSEILASVKKYLAAGVPSIFGFTVYNEIRQAGADGKVPFPGSREKLLGGHAIPAVGYDDNVEITSRLTGATTKGALLFQNSWGKEWGMEGYGWLPYEYVLKGLACDFWSILKQDWVDTGLFTVPE
jgi:C1A family cysteine protease